MFRENLLRVWVFSEWRWRQGHHIRMCPTQRTCLRPESSPHLVISPVAVTPGRGTLQHQQKEACSHSAGVRPLQESTKRLLTSRVALHAALSTPGPHPGVRSTSPCPRRPQFLTSSGSAIHFGQKDK